MEFQGYCVKCREQRTIQNGTIKQTANGRQMAQGTCPVCGTNVTRFLASEKPGEKSEKGQKAPQSQGR